MKASVRALSCCIGDHPPGTVVRIVATQHYQAALAVCPTGGRFLKPFYNNKMGVQYIANFHSHVSL